MFKIRKILNVLLRPVLRLLRNGATLRRMKASAGPSVRALGRAAGRALRGDLSGEESSAIDAIELLRARLLASDEPIEIIDYGAGASSDERTEEEMLAGVPGRSTVGAICAEASKRGVWSRLLFHLVRERRPTRCLEMGTSLGLSCAYQAAALKLNGDGGRIVTLEGSPRIADAARENLASLGLSHAQVRTGRFADTLTQALDDLAPVDFAFIDGHHDRDATLRYFDAICPHLKDGALLVFDDVYWSPGMRQAWSRIARDSRVAVAVDLYRVGLCVVTRRPAAEAERYTLAVD